MNWKALKTEEEHVKAVKRMIEIFYTEPNTPEDDELGILALLIKDFEDRHYSMPELAALGNIKGGLEEMKLFKNEKIV